MTGDNSNGQLGTSGGGYVTSFQNKATQINSVQCGADTTILKKTDGTVLLAGSSLSLTSFTNASSIGFTGPTPVLNVSSSPSLKTNFIIDADGYMWMQGYNGGQYNGGSTTLSSFTKITQGIEPIGSISPTTSNFISFPQFPKMTQVSTGYYYSIAIDTSGKIWAGGGNNISGVRLADSIGMPPTNYQRFQRNNIFQQSIQLPTDINVSKIDRSTGSILNSTIISGAGISTNLSNDANGVLYIDSIKNDSISYSTLVSVDFSGLVECFPAITVNLGDFVSFSLTPASYIQQGYVVSTVSNGFYLSDVPDGAIYTPGSALSSLPLVVTVGQNIDKGYTWTLDPSLKSLGFSGPFGTKCFSYLDRFDNYYISYVDENASTTTLQYKTWTVTISNSPCHNCKIEVDFLGNIYFVGDYQSDSVITGGGYFTPSWSTYGGTFIMKMNQSGEIKWVIQIENNSADPQYSTITKILSNYYTGTMYITGYINRNVNLETINTVSTSVSGSTYTIFVTASPETGFYSNGIFGFEFIFDPAGNLNPDYTIVPQTDFFQVPYKNLIGLHPLNTLAIPDLYPPNYRTWPPFNLINNTLVTSIDNRTFTSTIANSSWGDGMYTVNTSSVLDTAVTSAGIRCFDFKNYTDWLSSSGVYNYITGNYIGGTNLNGVYGQYVWIQFPISIKAKYLFVLQNSVQFWARNYTVLGSNDGSTWTSIYAVVGDVTVTIIKSLGQNVYTVSDSTKLYTGMTVNGTSKVITNIDYSANKVTLSNSVTGSSIIFNQMPSKLIYLNSSASYQYYAFSQQRIYYPPGNQPYNTTTRIRSLLYYD
jgi:hypothetical protein